MNFVSDQLANGRRFRVLNVVDDFSREMVGQLVSVSMTSGGSVFRVAVRSKRQASQIICDNGTEFTSKVMFFWSKETTVSLDFIQPGKPTQNAFVESLNGKFRNECLNRHWFRTLDEARAEIKACENITITFALTAHSIMCHPLNMLKGRHDVENLTEPVVLI